MSAPYYTDDLVTLYHGDCLDVLPSLSGVDLIVTSPPYNLGVNAGGGFGHYKNGQTRGGQAKWGGTNKDGINYADHDDAMPPAVYTQWQRDVLTACWGTLRDTGAIFYNHKPRVQASTLWMPLELNPGLPLRQIIVWARAGGMNYAPTHYVPTHEWIMVLAKPAFRLKSKGASGLGDVWRVNQQPNPEHPAPFPIGIPARAIETTDPALVLDPFSGSGTTLHAAADAGVRAIGIEKSERYCELTAKRLSRRTMSLFGGVS
ncbi:DNA methylase [Gordonia phage BritBrat]|uniref:DNA methylase n=1 Tax=Gordonia phage BritBrat TaxID=1838064 RepID=A0A166Y0J0_9CAUD|nr:DNA methylase [Gordonia phage BritBrat]ANA85279.1 DNA methylase [Gordonia phage BritBrat]